MKKWMAMAGVSFVASMALGVVVDEWGMDDNGKWQNSNNGLNLGSHYSTNNQAVAQVADDGTFFFSPSTAFDPDGSNFGGKISLTSTANLESNIVRLSWTYTEMDWSATTIVSNQVGFRIWNAAGSEWVGIALQAQATALATNVWAYTKSSAGLGGLSARTGRLFLGLKDTGTPRTVYLELDYANSEVRMFADSWHWNGGSDVHTNAVDFSAASVTNIGQFQTYFQNWGAGNVTTFDNLAIEAIPTTPLSDVTIIDTATVAVLNTATTNVFNYVVEEGDVIAFLAASNKGADPSINSLSFSGSASVGNIAYDKSSLGGPGVYYWHATVESAGVLAAKFVTVDSYASVAGYQLRAPEGDRLILLDSKKTGHGTATFNSITNIYDMGSVASGVFLEAASSVGANIAPSNPATVVDINGGTKRSVAHGSFTDVSTLTNIWTHDAERDNLIGLVFDNEADQEPYVVDQGTLTHANTPSTNSLVFAVKEGDVIAFLAASNKSSDPATNSVTFTGSATLDTVAYNSRSAGPTVSYWYTTALSNGTVNVELITVNSFVNAAGYKVRAPSGEEVFLLADAKSGDSSGTATSITNTYYMGGAAAGLLLEAASTYGDDLTPLDSNTVVDMTNGKRAVAHGTFDSGSPFETVWTNSAEDVSLIGLLFDSRVPYASPWERYEQWIDGYSVGSETNLTDDFDKDLLDNLTEYAWDGKPNNASQNGNTPVQSQVEESGTNYLEYVYYERDDAGDRELSFILNVGTDLIITNWATAGIEFVGSGSSAVPGYNAVTNRISTEDDVKRFLNLQIKFTP